MLVPPHSVAQLLDYGIWTLDLSALGLYEAACRAPTRGRLNQQNNSTTAYMNVKEISSVLASSVTSSSFKERNISPS